MTLKLGENIKAYRKEHSMTQEQLAEALNVTTGAVYKWESGQSTPEIKLLIELAQLFETSVDALLGYGWESGNMKTYAEKIKLYASHRNFTEGIPFAERALKKYPNSFEIAFNSADLYYVALSPDKSSKAIELYKEALRLISENPYDDINSVVIENRMAMCYSYLSKPEKAVELLKKNNVDGLNNSKIGLLLSDKMSKTDEALEYLYYGLAECYSNLSGICVGYANVYTKIGEYEKLRDLCLIKYNFGLGLRDTSKPGYMDRIDIKTLVILAYTSCKLEDKNAAISYLKKARDLAIRFDKNPNYSVLADKFCHLNVKEGNAYDDMGDTAIEIIENVVNTPEYGEILKPLWEEIQNEE